MELAISISEITSHQKEERVLWYNKAQHMVYWDIVPLEQDDDRVLFAESLLPLAPADDSETTIRLEIIKADATWEEAMNIWLDTDVDVIAMCKNHHARAFGRLEKGCLRRCLDNTEYVVVATISGIMVACRME